MRGLCACAAPAAAAAVAAAVAAVAAVASLSLQAAVLPWPRLLLLLLPLLPLLLLLRLASQSLAAVLEARSASPRRLRHTSSSPTLKSNPTPHPRTLVRQAGRFLPLPHLAGRTYATTLLLSKCSRANRRHHHHHRHARATASGFSCVDKGRWPPTKPRSTATVATTTEPYAPEIADQGPRFLRCDEFFHPRPRSVARTMPVRRDGIVHVLHVLRFHLSRGR